MTLAVLTQGANAGTVLPPDVKSTCSFTQQEFNLIFESGSVSKNGVVAPADSVSFAGNSLCAFYKWSAQMFLWLTGPPPTRVGGGTHVFDSPLFFAVSPLDANNERTLIPAAPGRSLPLVSSISQRGRKGQEVVFDSEGKMRDVVRPAVGPTGRMLTRDKAGQQVEIGQIQAGRDGKPILLDRANKPMDLQATRTGAPVLFSELGVPLSVRPNTVMVDGQPRFVTTSGAVIETEETQAGGGSLMAQNGSLVFYLLQVNDVWAYFSTGMKTNKITNPVPTTFPTTVQGLGQIVSVATQAPPPFKKPDFLDKMALAIELKSSWIDTAGLSNPDDYITIDATIPTYNPPLTQANNTQSVESIPKQAKLALVGLHVVGSTLDHPELIWSTFEHVNNAPNPQYTFTTTSEGLGTQPADGPGNWIFSSTGAAPATPNLKRMSQTGTTLNAIPPHTIGPSDVVRRNPWGTRANRPDFTANNTDIISINKSVMGLLAAGDARKNYMLTGSTWVFGGGPPSTGTIVGTPDAANSTMETFKQGSGCFDCHMDDGNMLGTPANPDGFSGGLSHIWASVKPLFRFR